MVASGQLSRVTVSHDAREAITVFPCNGELQAADRGRIVTGSRELFWSSQDAEKASDLIAFPNPTCQ
jgi:hypothetical protein